MKTFKLLLVAFAFTAFAQVNAQTAEEIVANYFENTGGLENWQKIEGIKISLKVNQGGMEIPVEIVNLKSGKQYSKATFQGKEIMQGVFDGETLWNTNFMSMKAEKSDSETTANFKTDAKDFSTSILTGSLINYKEKGYSLELLGKENVDGTETYVLKLTKKPIMVDGKEEDNSVTYYFDTENFVPIMLRTEIKMGPGKGMMSEASISDYQEVEGLYFPFSLTQGIKDQGSQGVTIDVIELNPTVDDSIFAFPKEEATPTTKN